MSGAFPLLFFACRPPDSDDRETHATIEAHGPEPCVTISPLEIDFGAVRAGLETPAVRSITLANECEGDLQVLDVQMKSADGPFAVGAVGQRIVQEGAPTTFDVMFDPPIVSEWTDQIVVPTNDPAHPTVPVDVIGAGAAPEILLDPTTYDFGAPYIGCPVTQPFTITNVGDRDLTITSGPYATAVGFAVSIEPAAPFTLVPGASVEAVVTYIGFDIAADAGYLTLESSDEPVGRAAIRGKGSRYGQHLDVFETDGNVRFPLSQVPVPFTIEVIEVTSDGDTYTKNPIGWEYDATGNAVVFDVMAAPYPDSRVEINYELVPDCDG